MRGKLLKTKKVLFFSPVFFGYEKEIKNKLDSLCSKCIFYDERINPNTLEKILIRLNRKSIIKNKINKFYNNIINSYTVDDFDYIMFFNPETITSELLKKMKNKFCNSKFILYMWDSFENKQHTKELLPFFDSKFTFNKDDAIKYNLTFRPLFFIDQYDSDLNEISNECDIDIGFIGTIHSDRYVILQQIKTWAEKNNFTVFYYMFFSSKLLFYKYKLQNKIFHLDIRDFKFIPLKKEDVFSILSRCKVVVDIQHPKQEGLTMRTIEMLGMKKKLITTNKDIKNYDFYDGNNFLVIERNNVEITEKFVTEKYDNKLNSFRNNYRLESFLIDLID